VLLIGKCCAGGCESAATNTGLRSQCDSVSLFLSSLSHCQREKGGRTDLRRAHPTGTRAVTSFTRLPDRWYREQDRTRMSLASVEILRVHEF
jgi:hypothetical protein